MESREPIQLETTPQFLIGATSVISRYKSIGNISNKRSCERSWHVICGGMYYEWFAETQTLVWKKRKRLKISMLLKVVLLIGPTIGLFMNTKIN